MHAGQTDSFDFNTEAIAAISISRYLDALATVG
jgi:hypothetical protein